MTREHAPRADQALSLKSANANADATIQGTTRASLSNDVHLSRPYHADRIKSGAFQSYLRVVDRRVKVPRVPARLRQHFFD